MSDKPFGMTYGFGKDNPSPFYIFYPDAKKATMYSDGGLSTFGLSEVTATKIRFRFCKVLWFFLSSKILSSFRQQLCL